MAFWGLLHVRDESDIIAQTLAHLLTWADAVFVADSGSTDGTWEIVRDLAAREPRLVALGREETYFHSGCRAYLFERVRHRFRHGDWVVRLDADEFYHEPPPAFVRRCVRRPEGLVRALMYEFVLTEAEARDADAGLDPRNAPIERRRRRYYLDPAPEYRLFRYRRWMRWTPDRGLPSRPGVTAYERIPIRHYRCRDPEQVRRRCKVRQAMVRATNRSGPHWRVDDWRKWLWPDDDPRLRTWIEGQDLPRFPSTRAARWTRPHLARQCFYGSGLANLVDLVSPGIDPAARPTPLEPHVQQALAEHTRDSVRAE
ncbi:MAG: glycosyltransferase family 2 protein [Phycisphaerae bacterium]|nr:glycosyltransferase family 2 protein [Phycisphaerae bacterium]